MLNDEKFDVEFKEPWETIGNEQKHLENELKKELGIGHFLFGKEVRAVARRLDCDDVLFFLPKQKLFAVVHLTWSSRREINSLWPHTTCFSSIDEWKEKVMLPEHDELLNLEQDSK